jgi:hypothetical protein
VALTVIGPPHHPHLDAACLRACVADSPHGAEPASESPDPEVLGCGGDSCLGATPRAGDRRDAFRRLPMPAMVRMPVTTDVTPMRHDATDGPGCSRCDPLDLGFLQRPREVLGRCDE